MPYTRKWTDSLKIKRSKDERKYKEEEEKAEEKAEEKEDGH